VAAASPVNPAASLSIPRTTAATASRLAAAATARGACTALSAPDVYSSEVVVLHSIELGERF